MLDINCQPVPGSVTWERAKTGERVKEKNEVGLRRGDIERIMTCREENLY